MFFKLIHSTSDFSFQRFHYIIAVRLVAHDEIETFLTNIKEKINEKSNGNYQPYLWWGKGFGL